MDGTYRAQCVLQSLPLLKSGEILVIDNVNRYLPSLSIAPNSRSLKEGPIDRGMAAGFGTYRILALLLVKQWCFRYRDLFQAIKEGQYE